METPPLKKMKTGLPVDRGHQGPRSVSHPPLSDVADQLLELEVATCDQLLALSLSPPYTYNPISYATQTHTCFVRQYCNGKKRVLFLGMNPGPFGMAQNGVPFGDTVMVRDWLGVQGHVDKPHPEHPKRPIRGLECSRREVSGSRFWALMKELCGDPLTFFRHSYVHNYCPLCFMTDSGRNITPAALKVQERRQLEEVCDRALVKVVEVLGVEWVVCVGSYVEGRAKRLPQGDVQVCRILHPSPINPVANRGWAEAVKTQLTDMGLIDIIRGTKPGVS